LAMDRALKRNSVSVQDDRVCVFRYDCSSPYCRFAWPALELAAKSSSGFGGSTARVPVIPRHFQNPPHLIWIQRLHEHVVAPMFKTSDHN
jgi:hypothetical protein